MYKEYFSQFMGQLWAARSKREYSIRMTEIYDRPMDLPDGNAGDVYTITHASHPRQLIVYNGEDWVECTSSHVLTVTNYLAISYRQSDFLTPTKEPDWDDHMVQEEVGRLKREVSQLARLACVELGFQAYWLDFECTGASQAEKNVDLYRIADVFRGAAKTVVLIRDRHVPLSSTTSKSLDCTREDRDAEELFGWKSWGDRVWTFPEALLSGELVYKFGYETTRPISLRQIGNIAYPLDPEEMAIINGFTEKDPLQRIERLTLLKNAIWRRSSGPSRPSQPTMQPTNTGTGSQFTAYPAERVYALMGFFEHRIMPDPRESPLKALARLSMANDTDRLAERMVAMLPSSIQHQACWYADDDLFRANLWDIEPSVQVAGITQSGALVLDGCHAAAIRWKNFPHVVYGLKPTFRRYVCSSLPYLIFPSLVPVAGYLFSLNLIAGAVAMLLALSVLLFAPMLIAYGNSGRISMVQPWLVGVKGFMTAEEASTVLYGCVSTIPNAPTLSYSPSGSTLAYPRQSLFREGDPTQVEFAASRAPNVYTLVDTVSATVYHFTASRPPTVCLFVGREGGLGRFVLCSETCGLNELHKETVLRMPSYVAHHMKPCDWLAVGSLEGAN